MGTLKRQSAAAFIGAMVVLSGLALWDNMAAVVWFERGHVVARQPNRVEIAVSGIKMRDCKRIPDSEVGYVQSIDGVWHETTFAYLDDLTPNNSKPRGVFSRISFGVWEWSDYIGPVIATMVTVEHNCGGDDLTSTKMGPFML